MLQAVARAASIEQLATSQPDRPRTAWTPGEATASRGRASTPAWIFRCGRRQSFCWTIAASSARHGRRRYRDEEWIPRTPPHPAARNGSHENHQRVRFHKVAALAANAELYEGGTIYIDNDISLKRSHTNELFAVFDDFGNKSIGFNKDWTNRANPAHHVEGIPKGFPERNGGVCFMRGAGAATITRDWLDELAANPGPGGTDQMPLRRVLWRHREHLFDLPSLVQCRCRKESICENGALLWHLHRVYRLDVLRRVGNASEMCGFVP